MKRRVVITGCGIVSPLGRSLSEVWDALQAGRSGVGPLQSFPVDTFPVKGAAEVQAFTGQIDDFGPLSANLKKTIRKGIKVMCREIQMGVAAAQLALHDARLDTPHYAPERVGVLYGSDYIMTQPDEFAAGVRGCLDPQQVFQFDAWAEHGMSEVTPLWLLKYLPNMPACHVAIYNDFQGPNNSLTVREASANLALAEACSTILRQAADCMVVGATGSRVHPLRSLHTVLQEELAMGDDEFSRWSRPFDRDRRGMVVGEGAATLILEDLESATARGANILAEIVGWGASAAQDQRGVAQREVALHHAMRSALRSAQLAPHDIGHLHAHGLATRSSDVAEARAINHTFAERPTPIPVVAAKSYFGNLGAASGMVELATSLLALQAGHLFRTMNYETPDPECPIDVVVDPTTPSGHSVLNVNVTPQGQASAIIVQRLAA